MGRSHCKLIKIPHCYPSFVVTHSWRYITLDTRSGILDECGNHHSAYEDTRFSVLLIQTELEKECTVFAHENLRTFNGGIWETSAWMVQGHDLSVLIF